MIGVSFVAGIVGALVRAGVTHRGHVRRTPRASLLPREAPPPAAVAMLHVADATASEFDGHTFPTFAPVVSLTEAQVERGRSARERQKRREALDRA